MKTSYLLKIKHFELQKSNFSGGTSGRDLIFKTSTSKLQMFLKFLQQGIPKCFHDINKNCTSKGKSDRSMEDETYSFDSAVWFRKLLPCSININDINMFG
ncbi:hypothetical protein Y1Q_0013601 [Alligator mississippiensis]|uniref:Uncharacterized protein n=1 Tax=Alligator mississippiensis TaxID=8496 RepID=A0A151P3D5_ALLMI|nr:hypothetical protein Y1Q_0013601 [Alligator mississippiensis]